AGRGRRRAGGRRGASCRRARGGTGHGRRRERGADRGLSENGPGGRSSRPPPGPRASRPRRGAGFVRGAVTWHHARMGYDLSGRLVVGVASSALFDLTESDRVFRTQGEAAYRDFQEHHRDDALEPGVAFGFVRRLLALNDLAPSADDPLVEVIVMSRNSPETGLRVMRSVRHHDLPITRAVFRQGRSPHEFIRPLHVDLFLSADERSVRDAVDLGLPAGYVLDRTFADEA